MESCDRCNQPIEEDDQTRDLNDELAYDNTISYVSREGRDFYRRLCLACHKELGWYKITE